MNDAWDGCLGLTRAGGSFGPALRRVAAEREVSAAALARALAQDEPFVERLFAGQQQVGVAALAAISVALRLRPIEFLQRTSILSLESYAAGLDPLYFLPEGPVRYEGRIYMREINPRHRVPEGDMTRRNECLRALSEDAMLDAAGKVELELAYLLRAAWQYMGGTP